jgi:type VI secretion system secreted protein VgrG
MNADDLVTPDFQRRLVVKVATGDALDVRSFHVRERVSSLFEVTIVARSENPDIDFEAVAGRPTRFTARDGLGLTRERTLTGVCRDIRQIGVEEAGLSTYELTLVPSLWLATQRRNYRIFQQKSELDIAREILAEWEIEPAIQVTGTYRRRKYRVQYGESDFTFLCRMLEDAGITFYFTTAQDETRLVLSDAPHANEARPSIAFRDAPTVADREHVTRVHVGRRVRPGAYTVRDHDYRRPADFPLIASAKEASDVEARLERYHYVPGAFLYESHKGDPTPAADDKGMYRTDEPEAALLAGRRLAAKRATARAVTFDTSALDLRPGSVLSFLDHPKSDLADDRRLLVLSSEIRGAHDDTWIHTCEAVSAELPYRPDLDTPKPRVNGVESATVVGPPGEEIHTDEFGRVRVHFHWDREHSMDDSSSCWIHVSQPWSGAGFGGTNLPRVGQEVIVDFLSGDPDRPIIVGRVYTNLQKTPYKLPENKTQSGWKSSSTGGTGGYNEIMFEDAGGRELFRVQAEKDLHKLVKNDESTRIGRDQSHVIGQNESRSVGNDRVRSVGRDEDVSIGQDRSKTVGRNETVSIGNSLSETVGQDCTIQIGGSQSESIDGDESRSIGGDASASIGGDASASIGGSKSESVSGDSSASIGGSKSESVSGDSALEVGGSYAVSVQGSMTTSVGSNQTESVSGAKLLSVGQKYDIVCGASKIHVDAGGNVTIEATEMSISASGPIEIAAGSTLSLTAGSLVEVGAAMVKVN